MNKARIARIFFVIALIVSIGGIINALNPKDKEFEVSIANLPKEWEGRKIAHCLMCILGL